MIHNRKTATGFGLAVFFALAAAVTAGSAPLPGSSTLLETVRKKYDPAVPLETRFTLSIYWSVREKTEKKQGTASFAPRDRFRVTVGGETFVSNGTTFWSYNTKSNQVVIKPLAGVDQAVHPSRLFSSWLSTLPLRELPHTAADLETARFAWTADSTGIPAGVVWKTVNLLVLRKSGRIKSCVMTDKNNNIFTYTFTGTVFGIQAPKETFEFITPKDARVVDNRP